MRRIVPRILGTYKSRAQFNPQLVCCCCCSVIKIESHPNELLLSTPSLRILQATLKGLNGDPNRAFNVFLMQCQPVAFYAD